MKKGFIFIFALLILAIAACSEKSSIESEYNQKKADVNSAMIDMNVPLKRWNVYQQTIRNGGSVFAIDLRTTYSEFNAKSKATDQKIKELSEFIEKNREELTSAKIDTYKIEQELQTITTTIIINLESMKTEISRLPSE